MVLAEAFGDLTAIGDGLAICDGDETLDRQVLLPFDVFMESLLFDKIAFSIGGHHFLGPARGIDFSEPLFIRVETGNGVARVFDL